MWLRVRAQLFILLRIIYSLSPLNGLMTHPVPFGERSRRGGVGGGKVPVWP